MSATKEVARSIQAPSRSAALRPDDQPDFEAHARYVVGADLDRANGQTGIEVHTTSAVGTPLHADQMDFDTHDSDVGVKLGSDPQGGGAQVTSIAAELLFHAAFLDDVERLRIATANRLAAFEREGLGTLPQYEQQVEALAAIEHQATLALQRAMRKHPLGPWVKAQVGIGEKQGARLLASIGDVAYNHLDGRPRRGPAELWAYCGYRPGAKRQKGVKSNWNAQAKMRARLVAESCIKQMHSPYRAVYDAARASWAERDTSDLHKHNHALRCVAKAVLKDLFLEARRVSV